MNVHVLQFGQALCKKPGIPSSWSSAHTWVRVEDAHKATCPDCVAAYAKATAGPQPKMGLAVPMQGTMRLLKVELSVPPDPLSWVELTLIGEPPRKDATPSTLTPMPDLLVYLESIRAEAVQGDLSVADCGADFRLIFNLAPEHIAKLFQIIRL